MNDDAVLIKSRRVRDEPVWAVEFTRMFLACEIHHSGHLLTAMLLPALRHGDRVIWLIGTRHSIDRTLKQIHGPPLRLGSASFLCVPVWDQALADERRAYCIYPKELNSYHISR